MKKIFSILFVLASVMSVAQIPVDFQIGDSVFYNYATLQLPTDTVPVMVIAADTSHVLVKYNDECQDGDEFFLAYSVIMFTAYRCENAAEVYFIDENKKRLHSKYQILLWQKK